MKKIAALTILILVLSSSFISCEKDDICADGTPTTPSMIVKFFNNENRSAPKSVSRLDYFVEGMTDTIKLTNVSEIRVPLRVDATSTKWGFKYSFTPTGSTTPITNTDFLEFKYSTQQTYISRACGFKSTFLLEPDIQANLNPVLTDAVGESQLWIQDVEIENVNIENENEAHISIFF